MLFRLFRKPRRKAPARPVRFRPSLETLEDRLTPSGGGLLDGGTATSNNGSSEFLIARVNSNGTLDSTFASKGLWVYASSGSGVTDLAVLTDPAHPGTVTGIVAAASGGAGFEAIKLTPTGVPDKTFGSGGVAVVADLIGESTN